MNNPPKEIVDLIRGSGNNFHAKVARWFDKTNWNIVISPYYMDQTQGKAREIDPVAEKLWPVKNFAGAITEYVALRLIIECKFVASSAVFWFGKNFGVRSQNRAFLNYCQNSLSSLLQFHILAFQRLIV